MHALQLHLGHRLLLVLLPANAVFQEGKARSIIVVIVIITFITIANIIDIFLPLFINLSFVYFVTASVKRVAEDYYLPKGIDIYLPA